jgi:acetyl esterase/lipase
MYQANVSTNGRKKKIKEAPVKSIIADITGSFRIPSPANGAAMYIPFPVFSGRFSYRIRNFMLFTKCAVRVGARRMTHGPKLGWDYSAELAAEFLRKQTEASYTMPPNDGREFSLALAFASPYPAQVHMETIHDGALRGCKFVPKENLRDVTLLFLHGGAYFYGISPAYHTMASMLTVTMRAQTYMLDYRLAPEHPYPAALEDALSAYRALLDSGISPSKLIVCGDSAGGNLTMSLLVALRENHLPQPALAMLFCPWVDVSNSGESMQTNASADWIFLDFLEKGSRDFANGLDLRDPRLSPASANFADTAPMYIQVGKNELLYDQVMAFYARAKTNGWNVTLDEFDNAIHDLQAWGELTASSREALRLIAEKSAAL